MADVVGNLHGLRPSQRKELQRLVKRPIRGTAVVSQEFARTLCALSFAIGRQIGVLVNRQGGIDLVIVGNAASITIPPLERNRQVGLRALRLIHTHLKGEKLSQEDLYDLTLLRLDWITAISMDEAALPQHFYSAYIMPDVPKGYEIEPPRRPGQLAENFRETIRELEEKFRRRENLLKRTLGKNRALLAGVYTPEMQRRRSPQDSMQELKELCATAGITALDTLIQKRSRLDPISLVGSGKAREIAWRAVQCNADMIVFDLELLPAQARRLSQVCDLKIIDRTQLILDIFACNARSRDGKLQVELAQLRYLRGRLSEKDDNMSRLTGGIGGRGPGETAFEIGRRRVTERITRLEKELQGIKKRRSLNRKRRELLPIVSIVGYTNAGKSTLLNALTHSEVHVADKLFATLDPTTRRLRFPKERQIIIADTVGFIHDLPPDLRRAFEATLEELADASLILHCIDASDPHHLQKREAVETILNDMQLGNIEIVRVYNKCDLLSQKEIAFFRQQESGITISAHRRENLDLLLARLEALLFDKQILTDKRNLINNLVNKEQQQNREELLDELAEELESHRAGENWHIPLDHALSLVGKSQEEYLRYIYSRRHSLDRHSPDWDAALKSRLDRENVELFVDFLQDLGYSKAGARLQRAGFYLNREFLQAWLEFYQSYVLSLLSRHDIDRELLETALAGCHSFESAVDFYCYSSFTWQDFIPKALEIYLQRQKVREQHFSRAVLSRHIDDQLGKGELFTRLLQSGLKKQLWEKSLLWGLLTTEQASGWQSEGASGKKIAKRELSIELSTALRELGMPAEYLPERSQLQIHYRDMLKRYHPDLNNNNNDGERIQRIIEAYSLLLKAYH